MSVYQIDFNETMQGNGQSLARFIKVQNDNDELALEWAAQVAISILSEGSSGAPRVVDGGVKITQVPS